MKKHFLSLTLLLLVAKLSTATILPSTINQVVDATTTSYQLDVNGDQNYDFTFNYFSNGAISVAGRVGNGSQYFLATGTISGTNNYPVRLFNNKTFDNQTTWKSTPIFLHSPPLSYNFFAGKGNQYIGGRMNFIGDTSNYYFYILINVSADGSKLTIIKSAYENEQSTPITTGTEGSNAPINTSVSKLDKTPNVLVFPQPASTQIEIQTNETFDGYKIFNLKGQLINEENYFNNKLINVANLPKGIYLLQLINNNNFIVTKKIIIE